MSMYRSPDISHRNTGTSMHRNSDEKIIFPDGRISTSETSMLPTLTCRKSTFCENVTDYPRQLVNAAIQRNVSLRFLESVDTVDSVRNDFVIHKNAWAIALLLAHYIISSSYCVKMKFILYFAIIIQLYVCVRLYKTKNCETDIISACYVNFRYTRHAKMTLNYFLTLRFLSFYAIW